MYAAVWQTNDVALVRILTGGLERFSTRFEKNNCGPAAKKFAGDRDAGCTAPDDADVGGQACAVFDGVDVEYHSNLSSAEIRQIVPQPA